MNFFPTDIILIKIIENVGWSEKGEENAGMVGFIADPRRLYRIDAVDSSQTGSRDLNVPILQRRVPARNRRSLFRQSSADSGVKYVPDIPAMHASHVLHSMGIIGSAP